MSNHSPTFGPMSPSDAIKAATPYYPHVFVIRDFDDSHAYAEARQWCRERFGKNGIVWTHGGKFTMYLRTNKRWCCFAATFLFRDEIAAFEFKLRWC